MVTVETIRGRDTRVNQYGADASAVLGAVEDALAQIGAEKTYGTVALMKADTELAAGDRVRTLGYYANRDRGAAIYNIVTLATFGSTPDGYGDHLLANGLVAELVHVGNTVVDAQFGVTPNAECSARWQAAFYAAADLASDSRIDGRSATFMGVTDFWTKNTLQMTHRDGSKAELMTVFQFGAVKAVTGGDFDTSTWAAPVPILEIKLSNSAFYLGLFDCDRICSGVVVVNGSASYFGSVQVIHFDCYGLVVPEGSNGGLKIENYNIKQWLASDDEWLDDDAYTGFGMVLANKDFQVGRGEVGWCDVPLMALDKTPDDPLDEVEGRNIFRGYTSGGTGGVVINNIHPMAGRPGGPARMNQIEDGGPSIIHIWNNTNIMQINFADCDAGITRIYGKGVELNYPNYIVGGANDPIIDRACVLDPLIRIYANGTTNPGRISIRGEQGLTIGFYDFEGNSWTGTYDAWNLLNRQSTGLWTGEVTIKGVWDPASGAFPSGSVAGDYWVVEKDNASFAGEAWVAGDGLIALVNGASTSTLAGNWEHNTVKDILARDESKGEAVEQGSTVIVSRTGDQPWRDVYAPGPGKLSFKMRVAGANPLVLNVDENSAARIDADTVFIKNWEAANGGDFRPVNTGTQNVGQNSNRVLTTFTTNVNLKGTVAGGVIILAGSGTPEGVVTAGPGSMYLRDNGGAGTTLYIKESGTGNTGWVGK